MLLLLGQLATAIYIVVFDIILPTNSLTNPMPIWLLLNLKAYDSHLLLKQLYIFALWHFWQKILNSGALGRDLMILHIAE